MNHLAWVTNRIMSHPNLIMPSNWTVATQIAFALNCRWLITQLTSSLFYLLRARIIYVHLFPVATAATPLRESEDCWVSGALCSVLMIPIGLLGVCRGV